RRNSSKLHTQRALNHARAAADHAARGADCGGRRGAHSCGDFAEVRIALVVLRIRKIGVVEQIEEFGAELDAELFTELEILRGREVVILQTRSVVLIAAGGPDATRWRSSEEVRGIERSIDVPIVLVDPSTSNYVGPVVELVKSAEVQLIVEHRERCAGLKRRGSRDLPTAEYLFVYGVVPSEQTMAGSNRQVDHVRDDGAMPDVK